MRSVEVTARDHGREKPEPKRREVFLKSLPRSIEVRGGTSTR